MRGEAVEGEAIPLMGRGKRKPLRTVGILRLRRAMRRGCAQNDKSSNPNPIRAERLTVCEIGALSDFDNVAVRIADVAAYLAVLGYRLRDELGSSTFP